jgi:hypothetical protein
MNDPRAATVNSSVAPSDRGTRNQQDFARYEFKYLLDRERCERIEFEVANFMDYDGYIHPELGNTYMVRSLYFDDEFSSNFYEKIDGVRTRRKWRVRTYAEHYESDVPIFLEEKGRHNERTYKHRIQVPYEHLPVICEPGGREKLLELYPTDDIVHRFVFDTIRRRLEPQVLVDYRRRPYVSDFDSNFRMTFDSTLAATPATDLFQQPSRSAWRACRAGWTILEIKFDRRIPAWFHRTLQAYDMRRLSISKFCEGMEHCGIAVDLS